jgi:inositol-phosphate phosphatase/L-galactose 1-phosphate phosphatase/histidinol-phosphatase
MRCPPEYIAIAERLADAARPIARRYFRAPLDIETKADETPVTRADREVEAAMRDILGEACPGHDIVGEEMGGAPGMRGMQWILDPIDGTSAFATGVAVFGTLIALAIDGRFALGLIDQAVTGERWLGAAGRPTTLNGAAARVSDCTDIAKARLFTTAPEYFAQEGTLAAFHRVRDKARFTRYGADCYAFGLLASGHVDLVVEGQLHIWDYAAPAAVIENAGGVVTDWNGDPLSCASGDSVLAAATPELHQAAMDLLAG